MQFDPGMEYRPDWGHTANTGHMMAFAGGRGQQQQQMMLRGGSGSNNNANNNNNSSSNNPGQAKKDEKS